MRGWCLGWSMSAMWLSTVVLVVLVAGQLDRRFAVAVAAVVYIGQLAWNFVRGPAVHVQPEALTLVHRGERIILRRAEVALVCLELYTARRYATITWRFFGPDRVALGASLRFAFGTGYRARRALKRHRYPVVLVATMDIRPGDKAKGGRVAWTSDAPTWAVGTLRGGKILAKPRRR